MKVRSILSRSLSAAALVLLLAPRAEAQNRIPVKGVTFAVEIPGTFVGKQVGSNYDVFRSLTGVIVPCSALLGVSTPAFPVAGCGPGEMASGFFALGLFGGVGTMTIDESAVRMGQRGTYRAVATQQITAGQIWIDGLPKYTNCNLSLTVVAGGDLIAGLPVTDASAANISGSWTINQGTCDGGVKVTGHGTLAVEDFETSTGGLANVPVYQGEINIRQ
jgi:hypothetical protein